MLGYVHLQLTVILRTPLFLFCSTCNFFEQLADLFFGQSIPEIYKIAMTANVWICALATDRDLEDGAFSANTTLSILQHVHGSHQLADLFFGQSFQVR